MIQRHSTPTDELKLLYTLAELSGACVSYVDVSGQRHAASAESLLSLLPILGSPIARHSDVPDAVRQRRERKLNRCLEPVVLAWDGASTEIALQLRTDQATGGFQAQIDEESGKRHVWDGRLEDLPGKRADTSAANILTKLLTMHCELPLGYHRLRIEIGKQQHEALLLAAPTRAYVPRGNGWERSWGVFAPVYAVRSDRSRVAGDFEDLRTLTERVRSLGGGFVGTLPLLAAFLDEPFEPSPYSPVSRLFWNEFYLSLSAVPELAISPEARQLLESSALQKEMDGLGSNQFVDYRRIMALKRRVLEECAKSFFRTPSERRTEFNSYQANCPRLLDYARFRATNERLQLPWPEWPDAVSNSVDSQSDSFEQSKNYHMYVQWLAEEQLTIASDREAGSGLYLDLPLGVNANGYDVWRERFLFAVGVSGGCPPDIVFPQGQNWGFVPLHPDNIRADGYRYVREFLHHQMRFAKVLRIDHIPSFHRVFWIPSGATATDGVYIRYPAEELYGVFALESHRHQTMLVGEDLGTVPPEVPAAMARHNFHRMYVAQYELKADRSAALPDPPALSVASINTHDMPPFAGFWRGQDLDERQQAGLLSPEDATRELEQRNLTREKLQAFLRDAGYVDQPPDAATVLSACLAYLCDSPARLLLVNLEDLWLETRSQNIPSTNSGQQNWTRKMRRTWEEFSEDKDIIEILRRINLTVTKTCRKSS